MQPSSLHVCGHGRIYFVFGVWSGPEGKGSNFYPTFAGCAFPSASPLVVVHHANARLHQSLLTLADCCFCFYYTTTTAPPIHIQSASAKRGRKKIHSLHHDHHRHHHENIHHRAPSGKCACLLLILLLLLWSGPQKTHKRRLCC